jgi:hypothetical protein
MDVRMIQESRVLGYLTGREKQVKSITRTRGEHITMELGADGIGFSSGFNEELRRLG